MSRDSPFGDSRSSKVARVDTPAPGEHDNVDTSSAQYAFFHSVSADVVGEMVPFLRVHEALALRRGSKWLRHCVRRSFERHDRTVVCPGAFSSRYYYEGGRFPTNSVPVHTKYNNLLSGRMRSVVAYDSEFDEHLDAAGIGTSPSPIPVDYEDILCVATRFNRFDSLRCEITSPRSLTHEPEATLRGICESCPSLTEFHWSGTFPLPLSLLAVFGAHAHNLTSLSWNCIGEDGRLNSTEGLVSTPCFPKLQRLRVSFSRLSFRMWNDRALDYYKELFPSTLVSMTLEDRHGCLSSHWLPRLLGSFQNLTELILRCEVPSEDVRSIGDLPKLQRFISTGSILLEALTPFKSPDLREVHAALSVSGRSMQSYHEPHFDIKSDAEEAPGGYQCALSRARCPMIMHAPLSVDIKARYLPQNLRVLVLHMEASYCVFDRGSNKYGAVDQLELEQPLQRLANVERLALLGVSLSARACAQFAEMRRLRKLELRQRGCATGHGLFTAWSLEGRNELGCMGAHEIAAFALSKTPLEVLSIEHCCVAEESTVSFVKHLLSLKTLDYLFWKLKSANSVPAPKFVRVPVNPRVCVLNRGVCRNRKDFERRWGKLTPQRASRSNSLERQLAALTCLID